MSISKKLQGGGGSFGALAHSTEHGSAEVTARSEALDATGRVRRASTAPVSSIVFNPLNPRKTIVEEPLEELAQSLARHQVVPITVVSRYAFLDAHPDQAAAVGSADFVALDGNRRLLAAKKAGLQTLRVDLNDDLAATASDMMEAALVANAHREGLLPFEEAQAIEQLLTTVYDGNQAAVARKLGKSAAWVGQRLALLHLTPDLQEQAGTGELPIEDARKIGAEARAGKLTSAEQKDRAEAAKRASRQKALDRAAARAERALAKPAVVEKGHAVHADMLEGSPALAAASDAAIHVNGVYAAEVPEQRDADSRAADEDDETGADCEPAVVTAPSTNLQSSKSFSAGIVLGTASAEEIVEALASELDTVTLRQVGELLQKHLAERSAPSRPAR